MKKNWIMRSAYLALAVLLITTVAVSGTFAKYTWSTGDMESSANVAKFAFAFGANMIDDANDTLTIDLFKTITDMDGNMDAEVVNDGKKNTMIAPGVKGAFSLNFTNYSEVAVAVSYAAELETSKVTIEDEEYAIPLEFRIGSGDWTSDIATLISDCNAAFVGFAGGNVGPNYADAKVEWRWAYQVVNVDGKVDPDVDAVDTAFGFGANAGVLAANLTINITVDQVD